MTYTDRLRAIGPILATLRKSKNLRQRDVATRLGVASSSISRLERHDANPTFRHVADYLDALQVTFRELAQLLDDSTGHAVDDFLRLYEAWRKLEKP